MPKIFVYGWPGSESHENTAELFEGTPDELATALTHRGGPSDATKILLEDPPADHQKRIQKMWNFVQETNSSGLPHATDYFLQIYIRAFDAGWNAIRPKDDGPSESDWRYFIVPEAETSILLEDGQEPGKNRRIKKKWLPKGIIGYARGEHNLVRSVFTLTHQFNPRTTTLMRRMIEESCWNGYSRQAATASNS